MSSKGTKAVCSCSMASEKCSRRSLAGREIITLRQPTTRLRFGGVDVAEGVDVDVHDLAKEIEAKTGVESRACVLGHIQRGGSPTAKDRVLATRMGNYAVKLLMNNIGNRVVAAQKEDVVDYDIFEALNMKKSIDMNLYNVAHEVSI